MRRCLPLLALSLLAAVALGDQQTTAARRPAVKSASKPHIGLSERTTTSSVARRADAGELCAISPAPALRGGSIGGIELPRSVELFIGAAGIFLSFSIFAVLQEDVYKKAYDGEFFKFTFFALIMERGINALVALAGMSSLGKSGLAIPHKDIFNSGVSQMLAMAASNEALRYVSYPTQVLGKSCKMVPVMAGGFVLGGKRYSLLEYVQVALITIGVCVFNFGGKKKKGGAVDKPIGLALLFVSLLMDMFTGGLQDKVKATTKALNPMVDPKKAKPTMHESMFYTNASGLIVAIILALVTGHLTAGLKFCRAHPQCLSAIVTYSLSSAVGQNFVYYTLTQFDPLVLTTVTTTRKIFSTLYSVFRNPANSLNEMQWTGCGLVFAGLIIEAGSKAFAKPAAKPAGAGAKASPGKAGKPKKVD